MKRQADPFYFCPTCEVYGCGLVCWCCGSTTPTFYSVPTPNRWHSEDLIECIVTTIGLMPGEAAIVRYDIEVREGIRESWDEEAQMAGDLDFAYAQ